MLSVLINHVFYSVGTEDYLSIEDNQDCQIKIYKNDICFDGFWDQL